MSEQSTGRDQRAGGRRLPRRALRWLTWWVLLMSLWVAVDDSFESDELLAGAAAAALAALAAEVATHQVGVRLRIRPRWLLQAVRLPAEVARDTLVVFGALARMLLSGQPPDSRFTELPAPGETADAAVTADTADTGDTALAGTRRLLLTGARSLAPNTFVLGIDAERRVMVVHQLVPGKPARTAKPARPGKPGKAAR